MNCPASTVQGNPASEHEPEAGSCPFALPLGAATLQIMTNHPGTDPAPGWTPEWLTRRAVQGMVSVVTLVAAAVVFPWITDPGLPRGMEVTISSRAPLETTLITVRSDLSSDRVERRHLFIGAQLTTTPLSAPPAKSTGTILFVGELDVIECEDCVKVVELNFVEAIEGISPRIEYEVPIRWSEVSCRADAYSESGPANSCYFGRFEGMTIRTADPLLVATGTERARIQLPVINFEGEQPDRVDVALPLDPAFILDSGVDLVGASQRAGETETRWSGPPEVFTVPQFATAGRMLYGDREARIFFAGLLAAIGVTEGLATVYPRWLPDRRRRRDVPELTDAVLEPLPSQRTPNPEHPAAE